MSADRNNAGASSDCPEKSTPERDQVRTVRHRPPAIHAVPFDRVTAVRGSTLRLGS
jgi:hypothetical protein